MRIASESLKKNTDYIFNPGNYIEKVKFEQANRVAKNSTENINTIKKEDLEGIVQVESKKEIVKRKIGFAV